LIHQTAIDVILLDVRMPEWDGLQTLSAIHALDSRVAYCFMSGDTGKYHEEELLDFAAFFVVRKPFLLSELVICVKVVIESAAFHRLEQ
jgi:DNA-binding response OmpR family regulator